jgi:hypothetical protein
MIVNDSLGAISFIFLTFKVTLGLAVLGAAVKDWELNKNPVKKTTIKYTVFIEIKNGQNPNVCDSGKILVAVVGRPREVEV